MFDNVKPLDFVKITANDRTKDYVVYGICVNKTQNSESYLSILNGNVITMTVDYNNKLFHKPLSKALNVRDFNKNDDIDKSSIYTVLSSDVIGKVVEVPNLFYNLTKININDELDVFDSYHQYRPLVKGKVIEINYSTGEIIVDVGLKDNIIFDSNLKHEYKRLLTVEQSEIMRNKILIKNELFNIITTIQNIADKVDLKNLDLDCSPIMEDLGLDDLTGANNIKRFLK